MDDRVAHGGRGWVWFGGLVGDVVEDVKGVEDGEQAEQAAQERLLRQCVGRLYSP